MHGGRLEPVKQSSRRKWIARASQVRQQLDGAEDQAKITNILASKVVKQLTNDRMGSVGLRLLEGVSEEKAKHYEALRKEPMPNDKSQLVNWWVQSIEAMKEVMRAKETQARSDRLREWRSKMSDLGEVGKWLSSR